MSKAILVLALVNGAAGAAVALNRAHLPNEDFWKDKDKLVFASIVTVACLPLMQSLISELGERKRAKKAELATTLHEILASTLIHLNENAEADWKKTGVQVFRVRRWWLFSEIQARLAKLRLTHIAPSGVKWRKGKGLIGKCWETGLPVSKRLDAHFAPYSNLTELEWDTLPADALEKYGLSYKEFKKINDKYGLVVAFPLTWNDTYIGCMTVDMPPECTADEAKVRETLSAAAPSIAAVIKKAS